MLKLYGQYRSRAFRVAWLCKESDIPYEHVNVTVNVEGATCKDPAYVALNPNARVPTIDDDGLVMWESAAVNLYEDEASARAARISRSLNSAAGIGRAKR